MVVYPVLSEKGLNIYDDNEEELIEITAVVGATRVIGNSVGFEYYNGQTFKTLNGFELTKVSQLFFVVNNVPSNIVCRIYATSGGLPTGSALASSQTYTPVQITAGLYNDFEFDWPYLELDESTTYAATLETVAASGFNANYVIDTEGGGSYSDGASIFVVFGAYPPVPPWTAVADDCTMKIFGRVRGDSVGEITFAKKSISDVNFYNCAVVIGARIDNELIVGKYPDDPTDGQFLIDPLIPDPWPSEPRCYVENDDKIKSVSAARQRAYQMVQRFKTKPWQISLDFIPTTHEYIPGNTYTVRSDRRGILGKYRMLGVGGSRSKSSLSKSAELEEILERYGPEMLLIEPADTSIGTWGCGDIGGAFDETWNAQSFIPVDTFYFTKVSQHFGVRVGGVISDIRAVLYTVVAGVPSVVLGASNIKTTTNITDSTYNDFVFSDFENLLLYSGTTYAIAFQTTGGSAGGNYFTMSTVNGNPYADGSSFIKFGGGGAWPPAGAWTAQAVWDHRMRIYGRLKK